jgi:hypothetical protein
MPVRRDLIMLTTVASGVSLPQKSDSKSLDFPDEIGVVDDTETKQIDVRIFSDDLLA